MSARSAPDGLSSSTGTVVALDLGTSYIKAARVNAFGQVEALVATPQGAFAVHSGVVDAEKLMAGATEALQAVWADSTVAVACSAAMHSLALVNREGRVLGPATTWENRSFEPFARELRTAGKDWWERTGTPIHSMAPSVRLFGMKSAGQMPPGARPRALKDLLIRRWTGTDVTDLATAAASGLINRRTRTWDDEVLRTLGLSPSSLPAVRPPGSVAGMWQEVPVIVGTTDGAATHVGLSAVGDTGAVSLGTSGAIRRLVGDGGQPIQGRGLFCYAVDAQASLFGGALSDAGNLLEWWARVTGMTVPDILREAVALPVQDNAPMVWPFWHGARSPYWDGRLTGAIYGLTAEHTRADVSRALLEAIVLLLDRMAVQIEAVAGPTVRFVAAGGLFRVPGVGRAVASALSRPVWVGDTRDAAILGAARLAFEGLGAADRWALPEGELALPELPEAWLSRRESFARMVEDGAARAGA